MAGEGDKTARVSISLDDVSFDRAISKVRALLSEVNKLSEATKRFGGGGGIGNLPNIPGAGSAGVRSAHQAKINTGNAGTDQLTRVVTSTAGAMTQGAKAGVGAMKDLDKALKDLLFSATPGLKRLFDLTTKIQGAFTAVASRQAALAPAGGVGGYMMAPGGVLQPPGTGMPWERSGMGLMGRMGMAAGGVGMAAMVAGQVGLGVLRAGRTDEVHSNRYHQEQPFWMGNRRAALGSLYGGSAVAIRGGDAALSVAQRRAAQSAEGKYAVSPAFLRDKKREIEMENPASWAESLSAGRGTEYMGSKMRQYANRITNFYKLGFKGMGADVSIDPRAGDTSSFERDRERALQTRLPTAQAQKLEEIARMKRAEDPVHMERVNEIYGGALGSMSLARTAGISGGISRWKDATGRVRQSDSLLRMTAGANRAGYDVGEWAGMRAQVAGQAGRGLMGSATGSMLSMTHGGLSNAVQLYGLGAQFGGGGAAGGSRFMRSLQGSIGTGGLDVTAASQVYGTGASMMTSGGFQGGGAGLMGALAGAAYGGTPGGDMLGARQVGAGVGGLAKTYGGGIDPLQKGVLASAALKAAGDLPYSAQHALMNINPGQLLDIVTSGKVPSGIKSMFPQNMTEKQVLAVVGNYHASVNRMGLARYSSKMGKGTTMDAAVEKFRAAGGLGFLSNIKGRTAKETRSKRIAAIEQIAKAKSMTTGSSYDEAMGELKIEASAGGLLGKPRGRGAAQTASSKSVYGKAAGARGEIEGTEGEERAEIDAALKDDLGATPEGVQENKRQRRKALGMAGTTDASQAADNVAQALQQFIVALKGMTQGGSGGRVGAPMGSAR